MISMLFNVNPVVAFCDMLSLTLMTNVNSPKYNLLVATIINTMALLTASGTDARLRGTRLANDILSLSEEVTNLCQCLDIDVQFRFRNILEVPLQIISDGHIIGFDSFYIYFKSKPVSSEELQRAHILFNFLAIVRHFSGLLGEKEVSELVETFKNPPPTAPERKILRTRSRRYGLCRASSGQPYYPPNHRQILRNQDLNQVILPRPAQPKHYNRSKRHARIWNDENAAPVSTPEVDRKERNRLKFRAGFI